MSKIAGITKDKVELKSEVVELGLMQDFERENKDAVNSGTKTGTFLNQVSKDIDKAKAMIKASLKYQVNTQSVGRRLLDGYKDLGVEPDKIVVKSIAGAKQWESELEGFLKQLEGVNIS